MDEDPNPQRLIGFEASGGEHEAGDLPHEASTSMVVESARWDGDVARGLVSPSVLAAVTWAPVGSSWRYA